jgi:AraC-like DNA-binding protein
MFTGSRGPRIFRRDGMVYCILPFGQCVPLFKLAGVCNYRIDNICGELDISTRQFRRIFTNEIGVCPKQWLKSERMVFARSLLRSGIAIKDISERLGFTAQKEFLREFRYCYKISPTEFRARETGRIMERLGLAS